MTNIMMITNENNTNEELRDYLKNKGHKVRKFEDLIHCYMQENNTFLEKLKKYFKPLEIGTLETYLDNYSVVIIDDENNAYAQSIKRKFPDSDHKIVMYSNKKYRQFNTLSPEPENTFKQRVTSMIDTVAYKIPKHI